MGVTGGAYRFVLTLHVLAAIVGFGAVFLMGVYGNEARKKRGREAHFLAESTLKVTLIAEWFIYAVPVLGFALLGMSKTDGIFVLKFGQTWVWLSLVLYLIGIGIVHGMHLPNIKAMNKLMGELAEAGPPAGGAPAGPPPQALELEQRGRRAALFGTILDLLIVVVLFLMVFKPGGPRI